MAETKTSSELFNYYEDPFATVGTAGQVAGTAGQVADVLLGGPIVRGIMNLPAASMPETAIHEEKPAGTIKDVLTKTSAELFGGLELGTPELGEAGPIAEGMSYRLPKDQAGEILPFAAEMALYPPAAKVMGAAGGAVARGVKKPILIDGDGITAIAKNPRFLKKRRYETVLTPHAGEMSRIAGKSREEIENDPIGILRDTAAGLDSIIVLKGAHSLVGFPDGRVWINMSGNSGMATAGSGDVLTGAIGAMFGLGLTIPEAVRAGVFVHGLVCTGPCVQPAGLNRLGLSSRMSHGSGHLMMMVPPLPRSMVTPSAARASDSRARRRRATSARASRSSASCALGWRKS